MAPATSKTDAAQEPVYPAPQPPQIIAEIVAGLSAHPDDGLPDVFGSSLYLDRVAALQNGAAGISGIATVGPFRGNGAAGVHPTGIDLLLLQPLQRQPDGLAAIQKLLGNNGPDAIVLANYRVTKPLGQGPGDARRDRSDQMDPVRAQGGRQDWHRDDETAPKMGFFCINVE